MQGDRLLGEPQHLADAFRGQVELGGDLLGRGLVAALLEHPALYPHHAVDQLHDVYGDADRTGLVGQRAGHGLADPPRGVRGELVAAGVVELLHGADQPEVALLDEVEHGQAAADVALGDGDDQAQVGLDEAALGHPAKDDELVQVEGQLGVQVGGEPQLLLGEQPGLDAAGQFDLLHGGQQRYPADLPQVLAEQVGGGAARLGTRRRLRGDLLHEDFGRGRLGLLRHGGRLRGRRVGEGPGLHGGDLQCERC
ncbi:hypothetical protein DF17_16840 [Streptomyces rimosus]|nr:hypothetical protein DF17_16840 [Streptomyces rimosus]